MLDANVYLYLFLSLDENGQDTGISNGSIKICQRMPTLQS